MIDFHAHIITEEYKRGLEVLGIDPVYADGFALPNWSEEAHLEFMREAGIEHTILSSPTPHLLGKDEKLAARIHRDVNSSIKEVCDKYHDKFSFVASVISILRATPNPSRSICCWRWRAKIKSSTEAIFRTLPQK